MKGLPVLGFLLLVPLVHGFSSSSSTCSDAACSDSSSYPDYIYCCVDRSGGWDTPSCDSGYTVEEDAYVSSSCSSAGGDTSFTCCRQSDVDEEALYGCTYAEASCDNDGWDFKSKCYDGTCATFCDSSSSYFYNDSEPWTCPLDPAIIAAIVAGGIIVLILLIWACVKCCCAKDGCCNSTTPTTPVNVGATTVVVGGGGGMGATTVVAGGGQVPEPDPCFKCFCPICAVLSHQGCADPADVLMAWMFGPVSKIAIEIAPPFSSSNFLLALV